MNVVSFEDFEDERQIEAHQLGLPRVILEGISDLQLFKEYWFSDLTDYVEFLEAADLVQGQGCTAVGDAVEFSWEEDKIPALGFLDRDRLFRSKDWPLLFTVDDDAFVAATGTERLYTTLLWEVEAYLLEPDLIPQLAKAHCKKGLRTAALVTQALALAVEECEHLLRAQKLFAAGHVSERSFPDRHLQHVSSEAFAEACDAELAKLEGATETVSEVQDHIERVLAAAPNDPAERLAFLLRYVNTKRYIHRLVKRLQLFDDIRGFLATAMYHGKRRPPELDRELRKFRDKHTT